MVSPVLKNYFEEKFKDLHFVSRAEDQRLKHLRNLFITEPPKTDEDEYRYGQLIFQADSCIRIYSAPTMVDRDRVDNIISFIKQLVFLVGIELYTPVRLPQLRAEDFNVIIGVANTLPLNFFRLPLGKQRNALDVAQGIRQGVLEFTYTPMPSLSGDLRNSFANLIEQPDLERLEQPRLERAPSGSSGMVDDVADMMDGVSLAQTTAARRQLDDSGADAPSAPRPRFSGPTCT